MKRFFQVFLIVLGVIFSTASMAASAGLIPPDLLFTFGSGTTVAGSIAVSQLQSDFGAYVSNNSKKIHKLLMQPTVSEKYMTTVAKSVTEHRASKATISDVVQGFTTTFNDKGAVEFTPITITNRRHKINVSIVPDEVYDSWIGFMVDNDKQPKDYPLVKYIIQEHILPKVNDNRELKLIGKGDYDVHNLDVTGKSMDGFVTILQDLQASGSSNVNFINLNTITKSNVVAEVESFADQIDELYQSTSMNLFADPNIVKKYNRAKRDSYGTHINYKESNVVDFSNLTLVPLPSMINTGVMFATPKSNFIRLINRNDGANNFYIQVADYTVKIFADWWEAVGFGIEEAVFAYVPDSGSGSASASASGSGSGV